MLELQHIYKKISERIILNDICYTFPSRGFVGIQGESGCGKSTLLYIIGMLDMDFEGEIIWNGQPVLCRQKWIQENISFMMQNNDTIEALTVQENITLACQCANLQYSQNLKQKIMKQLDIEQLSHRHPSQLSGGQRKRISIARSLLKQTDILLCDEPTGALNYKQAQEVMNLLKDISKDILVIVVSHDHSLLKQYSDEVLWLENGKLEGKSFEKITKSNVDKKYHRYSLIHYPIRQLIAQRNKFMFLFLFQWIVILAFFFIVVGVNGIFDAIEESELHDVFSSIITIEKKDGTAFDNIPAIHLASHIDYVYETESIICQSHQKDLHCLLSFLPYDVHHIQLAEGRLPQNNHEVIITYALSQQLSTSQIHLSSINKDVSVVGVLKKDMFESQSIYCLPSFQSEIEDLKNIYSLRVEARHSTRDLYQILSKDYLVYSDTIERVDQYQYLLKLGQIVASVFIGVSLLISLLLIHIVFSMIYFERKHDVAYLLSIGLTQKRLVILSFVESMILGFVIAGGGSLLCMVVYYYLKYVFDFKSHFYFDLVLKNICFSRYDLYIFIFILYMLMCIIASLRPMKKMMKVNMIDVLREE